MILGALLALLVGFDVGPLGVMVFCDIMGHFDGGDLVTQFVGLRVGVGQKGTAVGQPGTIDGATCFADGWEVGEGVGFADGWKVGEGVGLADGWKVGEGVGSADGSAVGFTVFDAFEGFTVDGRRVGVLFMVGLYVGRLLSGLDVGFLLFEFFFEGKKVDEGVGSTVGWYVGEGVGSAVGSKFGESVGCAIGTVVGPKVGEGVSTADGW